LSILKGRFPQIQNGENCMKQETRNEAEARPYINVTPLIDVLLVLLIIFMVIAPLTPNKFEAKVPSEPDGDITVYPNPNTLVVTINRDLSLKLNGLSDMGTTNDPGKLSAKLVNVFEERKRNKAFDPNLSGKLSDDERIQRTVFIKAPRSLNYIEIVKVIDGLKGAGANPVGLQIDELD
jgi:biopolymer transport protein ExbD